PYPPQTPSGGGRAPTPYRSTTPAKRILASGNVGLTNQGPLQKPALSAAKCGTKLPGCRSAPSGLLADDALIRPKQEPSSGLFALFFLFPLLLLASSAPASFPSLFQ